LAKESGLGFALTVDDAGGTPRVLSNDFSTVQFATPRGVQDVTGLDKSAIERLLLLADFSCTLGAPALNDATNQSHAVFKTISSTSVARTTVMALSGQSLTCEVLYTDYQISRAQDGSFTFSVPGVLADGTVPTWS
jgi:hypothetical protein